jgi:hypothetical protein
MGATTRRAGIASGIRVGRLEPAGRDRIAMDDISALKDSLANWDRLGHVFAALVLLGVTLVSIAQFEWLTRWSGLERLPRWQWGIGRMGALLLIVGLAGEIVCVRSSRNINDRITANLNERAAAAIERSKSLEQDAAQLRLQLAKLKWRVITPELEATLVDWLKQAPKGPVVILHGLDDEPRSYAMQIGDALKTAGFAPRLEQSPAALNLPGTWLLVRDLQQPPAHAVPIQTAFREIHVNLDGQQAPQYVPDANTVIVLIGSRRL